jgi:uncharacterized membrane protein YphA (DoxX/SURF4 family)
MMAGDATGSQGDGPECPCLRQDCESQSAACSSFSANTKSFARSSLCTADLSHGSISSCGVVRSIHLSFPVLRRLVLPNATLITFLVAYGELAIGTALVFGIFVRTASVFGLIYMLSLLFSSNFPGGHVQFWQYFGASLDHSVLALCFLCFIISRSDERLSLRRLLAKFHSSRTGT